MSETGRSSKRTRIARRAIVAGLTLAAVIIVATVAFGSMDTGTGKPAARTAPSTTSTEVAGPKIGSSAQPSSSAAPPASAAPPSSAAPSPGATAPRTMTEVEQPGAPAGASLPPSAPLPPLFTGPLPKSAFAVGALVAGFPSVIPIAKGSTIADSSVSSSDKMLQATLVAKTSLAAPAVIAFYQSEFAKVSLPGDAIPAIGGSTAFGFVRDGNSITLTVTPTRSGGSIYTVHGVLRASS